MTVSTKDRVQMVSPEDFKRQKQEEISRQLDEMQRNQMLQEIVDESGVDLAEAEQIVNEGKLMYEVIDLVDRVVKTDQGAQIENPLSYDEAKQEIEKLVADNLGAPKGSRDYSNFHRLFLKLYQSLRIPGRPDKDMQARLESLRQ